MDNTSIYFILITIFGAIFLATAIITVCALPGWIKIPNSYLKILFTALLLEVVACIFVVFNHQQKLQEQNKKGVHDRLAKDWIVLNEKGQISPLHIDSVLVSSTIDNFSLQAREFADFSVTKENGKYLLKNRDNQYIGKIPAEYLRDSLKFYNEIDMDESEFDRITFVQNGNIWNIKNNKKFPKKWSLRLNINTVSDIDTTYYNENVGNYDADKRTFHAFRGSDGAHYIVRISDAKLSGDDGNSFITYMVIRTAIESKLK